MEVNQDGLKEVLGIYIGKNESSKYWLGILNELKNREVKDILVLCADGLTGMKEAVTTAYPKTEYQRCIVHQVRNTLKYVSYKHRKEFATDLKNHIPCSQWESGIWQLIKSNNKMGWNISTCNEKLGW